MLFAKIALSLETSSKFHRFIFSPIEQNFAPVRSILSILIFIFKYRALAQDILEISSINLHLNRSKLRSRAEHPEFFKCFFAKIALSLETSSKFHRFIFSPIEQNFAPVRSILSILIFIFKYRALAQDILEISSIYLRPNRAKSRSRAEHSEKFEENRAPVRSILKILKRIALPCRAFGKI